MPTFDPSALKKVTAPDGWSREVDAAVAIADNCKRQGHGVFAPIQWQAHHQCLGRPM
jgi:hypothetical protein